MATIPNLTQKIQQAQTAGYNDSQINNYLKTKGISAPIAMTAIPKKSIVTSLAQEGQKFLSNTKEAAVSGVAQTIKGTNEGAVALGDVTQKQNSSLGNEVKKSGNLAGSGIDTGLGAISTLFSPITGAIKTLSDNASDSKHVQDFISHPHVSALLDAANTGVGSLEELAQKHPDIAKNVSRAVGVLSLEAGAKTGNLAKNVGETAMDSIPQITKSAVDTGINVAKGVKDVTGKTAATVASIPANAAKVAGDVTKTIPAKGEGFVGKTVRRLQDYVNDKRSVEELPKHVQQAIKTNIPAPYAKMIADASPAEKQAAERMLDMQVKGVADMSSKSRPEGLIGARIMQAVKHVEALNKKAGEAEGKHVGDLGAHIIDHSKTTDSFLDSLHQLGIKINSADDNIKNIVDGAMGDGEKSKEGALDFSNSEFKGPSNAKDRNLLRSVWDELKPGSEGLTVKNAKDIHTGRQALFNELKGRPTMDPFAPKAVSIAESARKGLLSDIGKQAGDAGSGYKTHTTNFAITHKALEDFYTLLGKKWTGRPEDVRGLKAGEIFNRIKGNAGADAQYVLDKIENLAKQGGFKSNIDPQKLIDINQLLKDIVGDTQSASLSGGVKRGTRDALRDGAIEMGAHVASGSIPGMIKGAINFAEGNTRSEQIRALRRLLQADEPF